MSEALVFDGTLAGWKKVARSALSRGLRPEVIDWQEAGNAQGSLEFAALLEEPPADPTPRARVPRAFEDLARQVACHREPIRWSLLYRIVWRIQHENSHLMEIPTDDDVRTLEEMAKEIRRDVHKMRAFVRFREIETETGPWFVAWFEPLHHIVEFNAGFFVDRFASMRWSILTPDRCAHWDGAELTFSEGVTREHAPTQDAKEELWRAYYANIFNPSRVKIGAMKKEMAPYYWHNLPEAGLIPELIAGAAGRVAVMRAASEAKKPAPEVYGPAPVPDTADLEKLHAAAKTCRACPLWKNATQVVFGEGPKKARVLVVGEQPGDSEDLGGRPFIGPAGKLFDRALAEAGVDRGLLYVTNAVKHFKWTPAGKRRLHQKPNAREVAACRPWLEAEIGAVHPDVILCLGGTAASSVLQYAVKVLSERGHIMDSPFGIPALITVHPSSLLRQPDPAQAEASYKEFVADLAKIKKQL